MPISILMPALSPTMTEGTLAKWLKQEGEEVKAGDVIAEIETDKAIMEVEAADEGVLGKILVADGTEGVAVNTPIAVLLEEDEDASALAEFEAAAETPAAAAAPAVEAAPAEPAAPAAVAPKGDGQRIFASPLARRMAQQAGIDLGAVNGSGPHGRIVKADIEVFRTGRAPAAPAARPAEMPGAPAFDLVPLTSMRKVIARRLTESKQQVPHFYVSIDCEIDALLDMRARLNGAADGTYKLSLNDFVIKTVAIALAKVPAANASWFNDGIRRYRQADISVAVALEDGLITPIIRDAGAKGLKTISDEMKELAERARDGKLMPEEYQGGTFSISNMGMYGVKDFAAVINPPQGCILAVGAGEPRPVVKDGALAIATVMSCTLSVDHRAVDGAVGAAFLAAFKKLIEDPLTMLL